MNKYFILFGLLLILFSFSYSNFVYVIDDIEYNVPTSPTRVYSVGNVVTSIRYFEDGQSKVLIIRNPNAGKITLS